MSVKSKKKLSGYDIGCRVIMAAGAFSVPFAAYFADLIYYVLESPLFKLISQLSGNSDDDGSTYGYLGIKMFIDEILPAINGSSENKTAITELLNDVSVIKVPIILTVIFFALIIISAVAVFVCAIVSNNKKLHFAFATSGFLSTVAMFISFRFVSNPITDGTVSLANFFNSQIMGALSSYIASVSTFNLSSAWVIMFVLFLGMFILSGANILVDLGETKKTVKK